MFLLKYSNFGSGLHWTIVPVYAELREKENGNIKKIRTPRKDKRVRQLSCFPSFVPLPHERELLNDWTYGAGRV